MASVDDGRADRERSAGRLPWLDSEPVDPERTAAVDRATILQDGPSARLFLRYHSEARNSFHRAYGELVKTLARDAEAEESSPNEVARVASPNEANSAAEPAATPAAETTSDASPAAEPSPPAPPARVETSETDAARPSEAAEGVKKAVAEAA